MSPDQASRPAPPVEASAILPLAVIPRPSLPALNLGHQLPDHTLVAWTTGADGVHTWAAALGYDRLLALATACLAGDARSQTQPHTVRNLAMAVVAQAGMIQAMAGAYAPPAAPPAGAAAPAAQPL